MTDPKEFIYEFFPLQPEWQLLRNPITLSEFEELPFVRSLFFRYQLSFPSDNMKSVMNTDSTGKSLDSTSGLFVGIVTRRFTKGKSYSFVLKGQEAMERIMT